MERISDVIKEEYQNWGERSQPYILLNAHTGSGKTYFILNKLLPHALENNEYLVYICNRKILREQIQADTDASINDSLLEKIQNCCHPSVSDEIFSQNISNQIMVKLCFCYGEICTEEECLTRYQYLLRAKEQKECVDRDIATLLAEELHLDLNTPLEMALNCYTTLTDEAQKQRLKEMCIEKLFRNLHCRKEHTVEQARERYEIQAQACQIKIEIDEYLEETLTDSLQFDAAVTLEAVLQADPSAKTIWDAMECYVPYHRLDTLLGKISEQIRCILNENLDLDPITTLQQAAGLYYDLNPGPCNQDLIQNVQKSVSACMAPWFSVSPDQILKDLRDQDLFTALLNNQKHHLIICTYQHFESSGMQPGYFKTTFPPKHPEQISQEQVQYVVWDEAHYLGSEVFNPYFNYWYDRFFQFPIGFSSSDSQKGHPIQVFLTATPDPLKYFLAAHFYRNENSRALTPIPLDNAYQKILEEYQARWNLLKKVEEKEKDVSRYEHWCKKINGELTEEDHSKTKRVMEQAKDLRLQADAIIPGRTLVNELRTIIQDVLPQYLTEYTVNQTSPFEGMPVTEFDDLAELEENIADTVLLYHEKWLIFTDNEKDATHLIGLLEKYEIEVVLLSASELKSGQKNAVKEYKNIVHASRFTCSVLITTSIMDCGVNIKDPQVKHIAIAQRDRTTFLQMLGRKRLVDGERISIYMKIYKDAAARIWFQEFNTRILQLVLYAQKDEMKYYPTRDPRTFLKKPLHGVQYQKEELDQLLYQGLSNYIAYCPRRTYSYNPHKEEKTLETLMKDYSVGKSSFVNCIFKMSEFLDSNILDSMQKYAYGSYQLSWLKKKEEDVSWVAYHRLNKLLEKYRAPDAPKIVVTGGKSGRQEVPEGCISSEAFAKEFFEIVRHLPQLSEDLSGYGTNTKKGYPKLKKINTILKKLKSKYHIVSKQTGPAGGRYSIWEIRLEPRLARKPEENAELEEYAVPKEIAEPKENAEPEKK